MKLPNYFPEWLFYFSVSAVIYGQSIFFVLLAVSGVVTVFHFSYFEKYVMICHCSFSLHSPNGQCCWTSFYVLICHLYILFGDMLLMFFAYFLNRLFLFLFLIFFCLFKAASMAYGDSQARGWLGAVAVGLYHSYNSVGSKLHLRPIPQFMATPDP